MYIEYSILNIALRFLKNSNIVQNHILDICYFNFYIKIVISKNENNKMKIQLPIALILINIIQDMILNNFREVLAVGRTPCVMLMPAILQLLSLVT